MLAAPGKTAPRLLADLHQYDSRFEAYHGRNVLADPPLQFERHTSYRPSVPKGSCSHRFILKQEESDLAAIENKPVAGAEYRVANFCTECRCHVDVIIDWKQEHACIDPCPNKEFPLHHFVPVPDESSGDAHPVDDDDRKPLKFCFRCSSNVCLASATIGIRPPQLQSAQIGLLTDETKLQKRRDAAELLDPSRGGDFPAATSINALQILYTYLNDSLDLTRPLARRRIPAINRKFMVTFGADCGDLLCDLGFSYDVGEGDDSSYYWYLPNPEQPLPRYSDTYRQRILDAKLELSVLVYRLSDNNLPKIMQYNPVSAVGSLELALGCLNYDRITLRNNINPNVEIHPYYAGLGALHDFSDPLLLYSFDRQVVCDPQNSPYYFECIQDIARGRKSEFLETRVMTLASEGHISRKDVDEAYTYFGIDPRHGPLLNDGHIIGLFQSRLPDIGRTQEGEMRQMLRTLGQVRNSYALDQAASESIETYTQALAWLGVDDTMADEYMVPLLSLKAEDSPNNKLVGRKAIAIIAETRNSLSLKHWLATGEMGQSKMDVGDAYSSLQIDDRTAILDDDTLNALFGARVAEAPDREEEFSQAVHLIKSDMQSSRQRTGANTPLPPPQYPLHEWPVGLQNIGNTCYLNSLLQFFYAVKPLRDMIQSVEAQFLEMSESASQSRKVGGATVRNSEVERAQAFARELQKIFHDMMTAPKSEIVPDRELARLTILKPSEDAEVTSAGADVTPGLPTLDSLDGVPVLGPPNNPLLKVQLPAAAETSKPHDDYITNGVDASSVPGETVKDDADTMQLGDVPQIMFTPTENGESTRDKVTVDKNLEASSFTSIEPPSRPPPMPPRPRQLAKTGPTFGQIENIAQQRDVTEVIGNVLFQIECAIVPAKLLPDGEQWDIVKDLFYGKYAWYILNNEKTPPHEEGFNTIIVNVASGPTDLYSALDDFFDPQEIETENKTVLRYGLILELPPILQINISRVMYDRERGAGYKIEHHLQFDEVIYLDRYTQTTAGLLERRKTSWEIKARLVQLRGRLDRLSSSKVGLDIPSVMDATSSLVRNFQEGNNGGWASDAGNAINVEQDRPLLDLPSVDTTTEQIDPSLPDTLAELARKLSEQVATIKEEMRELKSELAGLFTSYRDLPYRLHAVFIHRGTAVGGHYWVYICDYSQYRSSDQMDPADDSAMQTSIEGLWRCYNDSAVTPVLEPARTIFSHDVPTMVGVHRATPNLLVYVRDDIKERMIEAVCRQVDVEIAGQHLSANGGSYPRTTSPASLLMADGSASPIVHVPATEIMLGIDPERRQTPVTEILVGVDADSNPDYTVTTAPAEHLPFDDSIKLVRHEDGDGDDDEVDEVDEVREIRANTTSG